MSSSQISLTMERVHSVVSSTRRHLGMSHVLFLPLQGKRGEINSNCTRYVLLLKKQEAVLCKAFFFW